MDILKVIACLLDYPRQEIKDNLGEMALIISEAKEISPDHRAALLDTLRQIYDGELMDSEERYTGLFEQGRSLSLHLFEHVHGESRDRGQAMVDLMAEYSANGFEIDSRELPDFIPMFLEYLSYQPYLKAREWLADVSHILALLGARLVERESLHANLFSSLLLIAGNEKMMSESMATAREETPDNTPEALDKEWEEIAVTFGAEDTAAGPEARSNRYDDPAKHNVATQPLRWVEPLTESQLQAVGEQQ